MDKFKNIHHVIPHKFPPSVPLFLVHIRMTFLKRTSSRDFSIYVGHKFNTV